MRATPWIIGLCTFVVVATAAGAVESVSEEMEAAEAYNRALEALSAGQLDTAFALADRACALVPQEPMYQFLAGHTLAALGDTALALDRFARAAAFDPDDDDPAVASAVLLARGGRLAEAGAFVDAMLARNPDDGRATFLSGVLLERRGDDAGAERAYRRAAALDPDLANAPAALSALLRRLGRASEARDFALAALRNAPDRVSAHLEVARCARALGRHDEALLAAQLGLRSARDPALVAEAAEALASMGRAREAREMFTSLLSERGWEKYARSRLLSLGAAPR